MLKTWLAKGRHFINCSIKAKFILVFILCLILPLVLLSQIFGHQLQNMLIERERSYTMTQIDYASKQLDLLFQDMERIISSLITNQMVMDVFTESRSMPSYAWFEGFKTIENLLATLSSFSDYQYGITILTANNHMYQVQANHNNMLTCDSPLVLSLRAQNGSPFLINRTLEDHNKADALTLGRAIYQKGQWLGTIMVDVSTDGLSSILAPLDKTGTNLFVLQDKQKVLYSSQPVSVDSALFLAIEAGSSSFVLDNKEYLLFEDNLAGKGLSVACTVSASSIFEASRTASRLLLVGFTLIITATLLGVLWLVHFFTQDIGELNKGVVQFAEVPESFIPLQTASGDEVGQLAQGVTNMSQRILEMMQQQKDNERNKRSLEFQALQAQINPHMIYNTLNTITYLADLQNVPNIQEVSSSFAALLKSLSNTSCEFITITEELHCLNAYIAIKKYQLVNEPSVQFEVDDDALDCSILKLMLQPIVENAITHAFDSSIWEPQLLISIHCVDKELTIEIKDNGKGMNSNTVRQVMEGNVHPGSSFLRIGVRNVIERLQLQYGSNAGLEISSTPNIGTVVRIHLPATTRAKLQ